MDRSEFKWNSLFDDIVKPERKSTIRRQFMQIRHVEHRYQESLLHAIDITHESHLNFFWIMKMYHKFVTQSERVDQILNMCSPYLVAFDKQPRFMQRSIVKEQVTHEPIMTKKVSKFDSYLVSARLYENETYSKAGVPSSKILIDSTFEAISKMTVVFNPSEVVVPWPQSEYLRPPYRVTHVPLTEVVCESSKIKPRSTSEVLPDASEFIPGATTEWIPGASSEVIPDSCFEIVITNLEEPELANECVLDNKLGLTDNKTGFENETVLGNEAGFQNVDENDSMFVNVSRSETDPGPEIEHHVENEPPSESRPRNEPRSENQPEPEYEPGFGNIPHSELEPRPEKEPGPDNGPWFVKEPGSEKHPEPVKHTGPAPDDGDESDVDIDFTEENPVIIQEQKTLIVDEGEKPFTIEGFNPSYHVADFDPRNNSNIVSGIDDEIEEDDPGRERIDRIHNLLMMGDFDDSDSDDEMDDTDSDSEFELRDDEADLNALEAVLNETNQIFEQIVNNRTDQSEQQQQQQDQEQQEQAQALEAPADNKPENEEQEGSDDHIDSDEEFSI